LQRCQTEKNGDACGKGAAEDAGKGLPAAFKKIGPTISMSGKTINAAKASATSRFSACQSQRNRPPGLRAVSSGLETAGDDSLVTSRLLLAQRGMFSTGS
jgi:hypothetical protein